MWLPMEHGPIVPQCVCVNVNTTDATAGATALLLPAQNTHTLHDPKRDTEHARAGGVEDGLSVGGLDGGGDVGDVVCEEAAGDARPSPYRVLSVAPGRRVWRARRRRMVMNEAASAPVVSATSRETPTPLEGASAYCPLCAATKTAPVTRS